jgi:hypothetical protein
MRHTATLFACVGSMPPVTRSEISLPTGRHRRSLPLDPHPPLQPVYRPTSIFHGPAQAGRTRRSRHRPHRDRPALTVALPDTIAYLANLAEAVPWLNSSR